MSNVENNNQEVVEEKKSRRKFLIIFFSIVLIAFGASAFYLNREPEREELGAGISGYILGSGYEPGLTPEEIEARMQQVIDDSIVTFNLQSLPTAVGRQLEILFSNPINSAHDLVLEIDINGETIVRTNAISPDHYLEQVELVNPLEPGKHVGLAKIIGLDPETGEEVSQVNVEIEITAY